MNNCIWIETRCLDYYKFITKISYLRLNVLDIKYDEEKIYLKIYYKDYDRFKKYLISYQFKISKELGIRNVKKVIKKNYIFLITLFIGIILLFIIQNMIIKINIVHDNKEIRELLSDELDNYGIKVLSFKKSYKELYKIREEILDKYPDKLDWIEFESKGMVLNLRVEERIITETIENNNVCNIVAKKEGVITNIKVEAGEANVMINDYVREGDILIKGIINYNENEVRRVCASGKVYATTWWTVKEKIPMVIEEENLTGKVRYNLTWEYNSPKKDIFKPRLENVIVEYQNIIDIVGLKLYLKKEMEVTRNKKKITEDEAIKMGIDKGIKHIKNNLDEFDTIIDKKVLKKSINNSTMDIELFIVVNELISKEEIIERIDYSDRYIKDSIS